MNRKKIIKESADFYWNEETGVIVDELGVEMYDWPDFDTFQDAVDWFDKNVPRREGLLDDLYSKVNWNENFNIQQVQKLVREEFDVLLTEASIDNNVVDFFMDNEEEFGRFLQRRGVRNPRELKDAIYTFAKIKNLDLDDDTADYLDNEFTLRML